MQREAERAFLRAHNVYYDTLCPSFLSALTAIRIAKAIDTGGHDFAEVTRLDDAMAAISAKKICHSGNFKIVLRPGPCSATPHSIPSDILTAVDLWLFPSSRLLMAYQNLGVEKKALLSPVSFEDIEEKAAPPHPSPVISWIGPITDTKRLTACIEAVGSLKGAFTLRICGQGKPRIVMPCVRLARAIDYSDKVVWLGNDYSLADEIALCDAAIIPGIDITPDDALIPRHGKPLLWPDEIPAFLADPSAIKDKINPSPETHIACLIQTLTQM